MMIHFPHYCARIFFVEYYPYLHTQLPSIQFVIPKADKSHQKSLKHSNIDFDLICCCLDCPHDFPSPMAAISSFSVNFLLSYGYELDVVARVEFGLIHSVKIVSSNHIYQFFLQHFLHHFRIKFSFLYPKFFHFQLPPIDSRPTAHYLLLHNHYNNFLRPARILGAIVVLVDFYSFLHPIDNLVLLPIFPHMKTVYENPSIFLGHIHYPQDGHE
jgi:hypothetical protein